MSDDVLAQLRRATAESHRAVEELAAARGVATSHHGLLEHVALLHAHHRTLLDETRPHPRAHVRVAMRLGELDHDLQVLAGGSEAPRCAVAAPRLPSEAHAMGACYVIEGSRLGGAVLARDLVARGIEVGRLRAFQSGAHVGERWRTFVGELQACPDAWSEAIVEGAVRTFDALRVQYVALVAAAPQKSAIGPVSGSP